VNRRRWGLDLCDEIENVSETLKYEVPLTQIPPHRQCLKTVNPRGADWYSRKHDPEISQNSLRSV